MNWAQEVLKDDKAAPAPAAPPPHWTQAPWIQTGAKVRQNRYGATVTTVGGKTYVSAPGNRTLAKDTLSTMPWWQRLGAGVGEGLQDIASQAVQLGKYAGQAAAWPLSVGNAVAGDKPLGIQRFAGVEAGRAVRGLLEAPVGVRNLILGESHPFARANAALPVANLSQHRAETLPLRQALNDTTPGRVGQILGQVAGTTAPTLGIGGTVEPLLGNIGWLASNPIARSAITGLAEGAGFGGLLPAFRPSSSAGVNTAVMGALGGITPPVLALGGKLLGGGLDMLKASLPALRQAAQEERIAPLLAKLAERGGTDLQPEAAPLEGMRLTLGQATGNPNIIALEKGTFAGGEGGGVYDRLRAINNRTLVNAIKELGTEVDPNPATMMQQSTRIGDALASARNVAKNQERMIWEAVDPDGLATIPKSRIMQELGAAQKELYAAGRENMIPGDVVDRLKGLEDHVPLMRYHGIASSIAQKTADLDRSGDSVGAYALGVLSNRLRNLQYSDAPEIAEGGDTEGILDRLEKARLFTKQRAQVFDTNPLAPLFRVDSTGAARVEPEMVGNRLMSPTHPSGLDQARQALGGNVQDLKNYYLSQLLASGSTPQEDPWGNKMVSYAKLSNFLNRSRPLADRLFTDPDEQAALDRIMKGAKLNDRVQNYIGTGGSPTAMNLESKLMRDQIAGHVYHPTAWEEGIGGALVGNLAEGSKGTLPGYVAGRGLAASQRWYERALMPIREDILLHALSDPDYGQALIDKGTKALAEPAHPFVRALVNPLGASTPLRALGGASGNALLRALAIPSGQ